MDTSLLTLVRNGSATMWIIGACSILALAVAIERAIALWRFTARARALADAVTRAVLRGDLDDGRIQCERSRSAAADVFLASLAAASPRGLTARPATPEKIAAAVERERQEVNLKLRRNLWILGTVGATAPFIGLFGTVVGIMHAFHQMAQTGQGGFGVVAAGISEALVATAAGIAVALEAVVVFNFFNVHVQKLALQLRLLVEEYLEIAGDLLPALAARAAPVPTAAPAARPEA